MKIVLLNNSSVIERSSVFDYRSFVNQTFDCVRLAKFYCEFDYVRLSSAIEQLVFDWVRLPNCSIRYPGSCINGRYVLILSLSVGTNFSETP